MFNEDFLINEHLNIMSKKCRLHIKPALQMAIFCILFGISVIAQTEEPKLILSVEEINELIPEIEAAERNLFLDMKIDSEAWVETKTSLSDPNESWHRTPIYVSCTAWFDGNPEGKRRVDVHKRVLKWQNGAAPYGESSYSAAFDGKHGRVVHHTRGHSGKIFSLKEGKLLPDAPRQLRDNYFDICTGAQCSFQFFFNDDRSFSQLFRASTTPAALEANAFECTLEEFGGVECIKFGSKATKQLQKNWWFDPKRGFALLGHKYTVTLEDGSERLMRSIKVTKLKEVTPGIWWPTEATIESGPRQPGEPYTRTVYHASNVVANDPNFDDSIFIVPFPEGYRISDEVTGRTYIAGQDPNDPDGQADAD
jgi:hypothetical protein